MLIDEYEKIKGIVKTNNSSIIYTKPSTIVIWTKQNRYICYYEVDLLNFNYEDSTIYVHNNGYNKPLQCTRIKKISIL